ASAYPLIRRSNGRASILFRLPRYARVRQDVVSLALSALADRSSIVREYACSILAYSLRSDVIPQLASLQSHPDLKTRAAAAAAITQYPAKIITTLLIGSIPVVHFGASTRTMFPGGRFNHSFKADSFSAP